MKNLKRTFKYVKGHYRLVFISVAMIFLVQGLGLISPLLVKSVLDDCIMGIEYEWVEIEQPNSYSVNYRDRFFMQKRNLTDEVTIGSASIVVYKSGFYFVEDKVASGLKKIDNNVLKVTSGDATYEYQVTKLVSNEVLAFYQPISKILVVLIILLVIKDIVVIFATYIQRLTANRVVNWIAREGRTDAMKQVERLPIKYFEEEPAGKMASRISNDVDGFIIYYRLAVTVMLNAFLSFVFAYIGMFYLDYKLALISFVIYPFAFIWIRFFLKRLKGIAVKVNEARSMLTAKINEIINGINILQIFNFHKQTVSEFNEISETYRSEQIKEVKLHIGFGWNMINVVRALITAAIVVYFGIQSMTVAEMTITAGLIYAYNQYLLRIIEPIQIVFSQVSDFQHSQVRIERICKLIEGDVEDVTTCIVERYHGKVFFDDIWFGYLPNEYVLKGVSLTVEPGQMVGLVGHTGSGKSSLMNLLLRFYDLTSDLSGKIYVDGMDISAIPKRGYRSHIGIVLQEPVLFKGTIASNIRFGKVGVTDQEVETCLRSIGGGKIIDKFELGINHPINRTGVNLSSGEKQIVALARCVIHDPAILIMDEATSHIDTETEEMIKTALEVVCKNRTVIVIAHRLSTIYHADKIVVLDHGLKVEEGTHQTLVDMNGYYANMYRAQVANIKLMTDNE